MKIITGFDDGVEEKEVTQLGFPRDYHEIFKSIHHSVEVAENVMARVCKRELQKKLRDMGSKFTFMEAKDSRGKYPFFVSSSSVTQDLNEHWRTDEERDFFFDQWCATLDVNLDCMAADVHATTKGKSVILVDPLKPSIREIDTGIFKFEFRQKWALDE